MPTSLVRPNRLYELAAVRDERKRRHTGSCWGVAPGQRQRGLDGSGRDQNRRQRSRSRRWRRRWHDRSGQEQDGSWRGRSRHWHRRRWSERESQQGVSQRRGRDRGAQERKRRLGARQGAAHQGGCRGGAPGERRRVLDQGGDREEYRWYAGAAGYEARIVGATAVGILGGAPGWVHVREAGRRGAGRAGSVVGRIRESGPRWRGRREGVVGRAVGNMCLPLGGVHLLTVPLPLAFRELGTRGRLRGAPRRGALPVVRAQGGRRLGAGTLGMRGLRGAPRGGALAVAREHGRRRLGAGALGPRGAARRKGTSARRASGVVALAPGRHASVDARMATLVASTPVACLYFS